MPDTVLKAKVRHFHFGPSARYHVITHQGDRGRYRWRVIDANTNKTRALPPVFGWTTRAKAADDARDFFGGLGVELVPVEKD